MWNKLSSFPQLCPHSALTVLLDGPWVRFSQWSDLGPHISLSLVLTRAWNSSPRAWHQSFLWPDSLPSKCLALCLSTAWKFSSLKPDTLAHWGVTPFLTKAWMIPPWDLILVLTMAWLSSLLQDFHPHYCWLSSSLGSDPNPHFGLTLTLTIASLWSWPWTNDDNLFCISRN